MALVKTSFREGVVAVNAVGSKKNKKRENVC